jgi:uncharacterized protein with HEPN domain
MPQRDPGDYLEDIEHYAAAAVRLTSRLSLEQYLADEKTRAAVERVLEVCGEAMSNLYRVAPTVAETIPHRILIKHGLVVRTADRKICVPYDVIHADFDLRAVA